MNRRLVVGSILLISFLLIIGSSLVMTASGSPQYGGTLRCALASEPGKLDM